MRYKLIATLMVVLGALIACVDAVPEDGSARILAMGDSMLAWGSGRRAAIPDALAETLAEPVVNRARTGAQMTTALAGASLGYNIPRQYAPGPWDWVVMSGGGNDLFFGCRCESCDALLNQLITPEGTQGAIPALVSQARGAGAQVIYVGYLPSPGVESIADACEDEAKVLEARLARMASADSGVTFLSFADLVPFGDKSYHVGDMVHPSQKARREVARQIADVIR